MKAEIVQSLRSQYNFDELLHKVGIKRATFYDWQKRGQRPDKYADVKAYMRQIFTDSMETYGYRRMHKKTVHAGFPYCEETIRKLMTVMNMKVSVYSKHTAKYSSYKGTIGHIAPNKIKQTFVATKVRTVLHTDVTQLRLATGGWAYISAVIDEANGEVLTACASSSPNKVLINKTINELKPHLKPSIQPILHSDQGWQYQTKDYQATLERLNIIQSMSRKGNCHDNAPIESFFNLLKREYLKRVSFDSISKLQVGINHYINWFNNDRISMNKNGLSPVEYRRQTETA